MKKFFTFIFVILTFVQFGFSVDKQIDFFRQEPEKIVKDMSNKLKDGYVVKSETYKYYGENINYTVNCKKDDPNDFYIFFTCNKQENLLNFYKDYLKDYIGQSYKVFLEVSVDEDEIETSYTISIDKKPFCVIYAKINFRYGLRGFGVTYGNKYSRETLRSSNISSVANEGPVNYSLEFLHNLNLSNIKPGVCYLRNLTIPNSVKIGDINNIREGEGFWTDDELDVVYFDTAALVSSESGIGRYTIKIYCDNDLKNDDEFRNLFLIGNRQIHYPFNEILAKESYAVLSFSEITRFRINSVISKRLFEKMKNNFYIEITEVKDEE